jgi:hypothetical protein
LAAPTTTSSSTDDAASNVAVGRGQCREVVDVDARRWSLGVGGRVSEQGP